MNVYNGLRIHSVAPTRLWVDGKDVKDWRQAGFYPVSSSKDREESLFYQMLRLRIDNPEKQPTRIASESLVCAKNMEE